MSKKPLPLDVLQPPWVGEADYRAKLEKLKETNPKLVHDLLYGQWDNPDNARVRPITRGLLEAASIAFYDAMRESDPQRVPYDGMSAAQKRNLCEWLRAALVAAGHPTS